MIRARSSRSLVLFLAIVLSFPSVRAGDPSELETAVALYNAKRVPEARDKLAALVEAEPSNVRALWYLGRSQLAMQQRELAAATLARAAKLAPDDHRILADYGSASLLSATELGVSFRALGYARRGRAALERAVELAPDKIAYREGLVQFYTRAPGFAGGDFDKAYAHIDEIAKRDPARGAVIRATTLAAEKRYDEAVAACETFLRDHPDTYLALYTLGRISSETGRELARGEAALRRCLEITPRVEEPDHAGARYRLGMIAEKSGRPADARREYEAALGLQPEFPEVREALARLKG